MPDWVAYHPSQGQAVKHALKPGRGSQLVAICEVVLTRAWIAIDENAPLCPHCSAVIGDAAEALVDNIKTARGGDVDA